MDEPLSPRDAFKVGFLYRCAETGSDPELLLDRLVQLEKRADEEGGGLGSALNPFNWLRFGGRMGLYGLGAAAGLGAAGGYAAHSLMNSPVDPEEAKRQELIGAYNSYAEQIRQRNKARAAEKPRP
jgi:hypothetical protein